MTDVEQHEMEELGWHTYLARCDAVLRGGAPACRSKGPHHAKCVRMPGHRGFGEGPWFDAWGPRYESWLRRGTARGVPIPHERRLA